MQAVVVHATGGPDVLKLEPVWPRPQRGAGQALVRVSSTSVNPIDTAIRAGKLPDVKLPKILGGDLAGVVEDAAPGSRFAPGDAVAALTPDYWYDRTTGTYAQYAAVDEAHLAKLPPGVDAATAGGVPLVALTAWQALMAAKPVEGQRVLVMAAAGGVGHMAVQLAKALGLHVAAVAGAANVGWVKDSLGADEVVDYSTQDFTQVFKDRPFDIVVDCLPGNIPRCASVLKPGGHLSHIANHGTDNAALAKLGERGSLTLVSPNGSQLAEVLQLLAAGKVKLEIAKTFPLADAAEAHRQVETGHTRGKVLLAIP